MDLGVLLEIDQARVIPEVAQEGRSLLKTSLEQSLAVFLVELSKCFFRPRYH